MDLEKIKHLAELSKLELSDEEKQNLAKDLDSLVELADIVRNANIDATSKIRSIDMCDLREDTAQESVKTEILLRNAPVENKGCFVVPKVVE